MTRFLKLPGTARRYWDTEKNEEISRREFEKRRGTPLPKKGHRRPPPEPISEDYVLSRKGTHRWYAEEKSVKAAPRKQFAHWRYQLQIFATLRVPHTNIVFYNVSGWSYNSMSWTGDNYARMLDEACNDARSRVGDTDAIVVKIESVTVHVRKFLRRTKANAKRYDKTTPFTAAARGAGLVVL